MTGKIIFCIIIGIWVFIGFLGNLNAKTDRINYEMIFFMLFALFVPIIAHFCGLV